MKGFGRLARLTKILPCDPSRATEAKEGSRVEVYAGLRSAYGSMSLEGGASEPNDSVGLAASSKTMLCVVEGVALACGVSKEVVKALGARDRMQASLQSSHSGEAASFCCAELEQVPPKSCVSIFLTTCMCTNKLWSIEESVLLQSA
jgi:hypothetical protein